MFASEQSLKYHLNKKTKCNTLVCTKCEAVFTNDSSLTIHRIQCENTLTEQQIRHKNYDYLMSNSSVIIEFNKIGTLTYISPNCEEIYGYTSEECLKMSPYFNIYENDIQYIIKRHEMYNNEGLTSDDIRYRKIHRNGSLIWIQATEPVFVNDENSVCIEKVITEQKKLEETSIRGLCADQIHDYLFECTDDGLIRYINSPMEKMSGYNADTIIGKTNITELFDFTNFMLQDGKYDCFFITKNGTKIQVEVTVKKYNSEVFTVIFKKYEINKNELFRSFVHELRNPINSLCQGNDYLLYQLAKFEKDQLSNLDDLHQQLYTENFKDMNQNQNIAITHIKHLLNDFLDFEKIQANTFVINTTEQCSIKQIIDETKAMIDPYLYFEEKTINYNCNDICDKIVTVDKTRVCQILINLLQNAIKYSKGNIINLTINISNGSLKCNIIHPGDLNNSHIQYIFDPFYRVNMNKNDGTGLGLFICKNIVEKMNGTICFVKSNTNLYNEINIELSLPIRISSPYIKNKTMLIVDDFAGIRSTKMLLETKGFVVTVVNSGIKCIELCENKVYDIILMDKNMNGMCGIETVNKLRSNGYSGIIYGFTGDCFVSVSEAFDCSSLGVDDVLYKPLDIDLFIKKIKPFLT